MYLRASPAPERRGEWGDSVLRSEGESEVETPNGICIESNDGYDGRSLCVIVACILTRHS